jgi:transposase
MVETYGGLDVHKDSVFLCIVNEFEKKVVEERFGTLTTDLCRLRDTLLRHNVRKVVMESTSIYWQPVWRVLSPCEPHLCPLLVNPYFVSQLPGRKSDVKDAHWLSVCALKGLCKPSFVLPLSLWQSRYVWRRYDYLRKRIVRVEQQIDNYLQRCNIRLSNYVSNQGQNVSLRKVVNAIVGGERDPVQLAKLVHGRTRNRHGTGTITSALTGMVTDVDAALLGQCLSELVILESQQATCLNLLEESAGTTDHAEEIRLLCTIPGIKETSALGILAELGGNVDAFANAAALVGWAGLRPRNDESAGKIKSKHIMHGNKYLRQILVQAAWAAVRKHGCFLGVKYHQLNKRKSAQKAIMAIARKLLVIIYNMLSKREPFDCRRNMPLEAIVP